jgi:BNR/Asp-box repeat
MELIRRGERLRDMRPLAALALIALAVSGCIGSSSGGSAQTISVKPRVAQYQIDHGVSTGDTIRCVQGQHVLTAVVPERGHGVGNGAGFAVSVRSSGRVEVLCPAPVGIQDSLPSTVRATAVRDCPHSVLSPGPTGTPLSSSEIGARSASVRGLVYGLANRGDLFGVAYPAISRNNGRTWQVDGPCFYFAAAQGASVVDRIDSTSTQDAYAWGQNSLFVRATQDAGRHWWRANFPVPTHRVANHDGTLTATLDSQADRVTYTSTDGGRTWQLG